MIGLITAKKSLLTAHILIINGDPTGLGDSFEGTPMHLMLADPIEKHVKGKGRGASISSALAGRGTTGVDLRWYNRDEFKNLNQAQKDELRFCGGLQLKAKQLFRLIRFELKLSPMPRREILKEGEEIQINPVVVVVVTTTSKLKTKLIKLRRHCRRNTKRRLQR